MLKTWLTFWTITAAVMLLANGRNRRPRGGGQMK